MATKTKKKQKDPNATPRLKFPYVRKEVSKEEFETAVAEVQTAWRNHQVSTRDFGWKLLKLRKLMYTHGQFTKWLRAHSIDINHASYCMRTVQGLTKKSQERIKNLPVSLCKKQLDELFVPRAEKAPDFELPKIAELVVNVCAQFGASSAWTFKPDLYLERRIRKDEGRTVGPLDEDIVSRLAAKVTGALDEILNELFEWETYRVPDTGRDMRVPPAGKKAQEKRMAAAASAGGPPKAPPSTTPPPLAGQTK